MPFITSRSIIQLMQMVIVLSSFCLPLAVDKSRPVLIVKLLETHENFLLKKMNFNRKDSLNMAEVLKDPQFVEFLKKWELNRRPSAVRAIFASKIQSFLSSYFLISTFYNFNPKTNFNFFSFFFHDFSPRPGVRFCPMLTLRRQWIAIDVTDRRSRRFNRQKSGWGRRRGLAKSNLSGIWSAAISHWTNREEVDAAASLDGEVSRHSNLYAQVRDEQASMWHGFELSSVCK